jgi:methylated-DNA-protein-cysteine methyltransferase-like protein
MAARAKRQKPEAKVRSQASKLGSAAKPEMRSRPGATAKPEASPRRGTRSKPAGGAARPEAAQSGPQSPSLFSETVFRAVRAIPRGQVRSYAQVALYAGRPGAARGVGHELTGLPPARQRDVPWWRVIRSDGTLAPMVAHEQAKRLRAEGVEVRQRGEVFRVKVDDDGRG